jgi:cyclic beta-1,2-glucan glucanotransferase
VVNRPADAIRSGSAYPFHSLTPERYFASIVSLTLSLTALLILGLGVPYPLTPLFPIFVFLLALSGVDVAVSLYTSLFLTFRKVPAAAVSPTLITDNTADIKTAVVVPALLIDIGTIGKLLRALEAHYLSSRGGQIYFGLLTDFCDAATPIHRADAALIECVSKGVQGLNDRYNKDGEQRFFLLHRPRRWAAAQGVWMAYERKRGCLMQFNEALCSGDFGIYTTRIGPVERLAGTRYVITLDDDNRLPDHGAQKLIQQMVAPNHTPLIDATRRIVIRGHAVLQPSIAVRVSASSPTRYQYLQTSGTNAGPGIDDFYQQAFDETLFMGKAIFCVQTFQAVLGQRFPENLVLSHDLLEGCYLRCSLVTDVAIMEEVPRTVPIVLTQLHRWIRGDCQAVSWVLSRAPVTSPQDSRNPLSSLSRWKLAYTFYLDLAPCAVLGALATGWLSYGHGLRMVTSILLPRALPYVFGFAMSLIAASAHRADTFRRGVKNIPADLAREVLYCATLPCLAWNALSATCTSLWRMGITRRNLLQWRSTARLALESRDTLAAHIVALRANLFATLSGVALVRLRFMPLDPTLIAFLSFWLLAPILSWWLAQPPRRAR